MSTFKPRSDGKIEPQLKSLSLSCARKGGCHVRKQFIDGLKEKDEQQWIGRKGRRKERRRMDGERRGGEQVEKGERRGKEGGEIDKKKERKRKEEGKKRKKERHWPWRRKKMDIFVILKIFINVGRQLNCIEIYQQLEGLI